MKLWTKEIESKAAKYPIYSQDGKGLDAKVLVKYFNPYGVGTWLITEAEKGAGDDFWTLYGYCNLGGEWEWGYVSLKELEDLRINIFGCKLPIERDLYLSSNATVRDCI